MLNIKDTGQFGTSFGLFYEKYLSISQKIGKKDIVDLLNISSIFASIF